MITLVKYPARLVYHLKQFINTCLDKSVVEDQVDSGLGSRVCALISFLSAGVGALQLDVALASRNVLALHLPHHAVDELDRVGVGKQLIACKQV